MYRITQIYIIKILQKYYPDDKRTKILSHANLDFGIERGIRAERSFFGYQNILVSAMQTQVVYVPLQGHRRRCHCQSRRSVRCVDHKSGQGAHAFDRKLIINELCAEYTNISETRGTIKCE